MGWEVLVSSNVIGPSVFYVDKSMGIGVWPKEYEYESMDRKVWAKEYGIR